MAVSVSQPMSAFAQTILNNKYAHTVHSGRKETWDEVAERQAECVVRPYLNGLADRIKVKIEERKFMPGGRYLYATGRKFPQVNNCFLFKAYDSREGWGDLFNKAANALMTGGGIGVVYSGIRAEGEPVGGMGGTCSGPVSLAKIVNEQGRYMKQGGSRRSAIWAGLIWNHPDIFKFIGCKEWDEHTRLGKAMDFNYPAAMDMTNISVILDDAFFDAYYDKTNPQHDWACDVYWASVRGLLRTGEPGFSVDIGENTGESLRNACTEVTSRDDSDMCNLGSINMANVDTQEEFNELVELGTAFLLCGTLYSKLPLEGMYRVREKNRRIGLGLMGVHEWLLKRGHKYGPNDELAEWMKIYRMSGAYANRYADKLSISRPIATRSIAPTGTISIIAETTSGIEPIFATALKRRYLDGSQWKAQFIVDATARRLIDAGTDPDLIEDSLTLAEDVERRMHFQAWLQKAVDHGISSTINLPMWGTTLNNESNVNRFGTTLLRYLPELRGITGYPDGARDGQPLVKASYHDAIRHLGEEFVDSDSSHDEMIKRDELAHMASQAGCKSGVCGE